MGPLAITVAIPTYKRPRQFKRALESVLNQSEPADAIVVGDDAGQEEVREICRSCNDDRIVYVSRRPKYRMAENWDFVVRWADDGFVALLEDDNIWLPEHLAHARTVLRRFPEAGLYHAGHREAWDTPGEDLKIYKTVQPPWHAALACTGGGFVPAAEVVLDALECGSINSSTTVIRRALLDQVPGFDGRYLMGMDTLMWTRLAMLAPCAYGPYIDTIYTYHGLNVSTAEVRARRAGRQFRASRRLILAEALSKHVVSPETVAYWLEQLDAAELGSILPMLAHPTVERTIRDAARCQWRRRRQQLSATRYLKASRYAGFWILAHVDQFDLALGALASAKSRLTG